MEIINLKQFNFDYELQFIDFIVLLLDPFIKFNINENNELSIFKKGKDKLEKLNKKDFINFIHYIFPEIINEQLYETEFKLKIKVDNHKYYLDKKEYLLTIKNILIKNFGKIKNVLNFLDNLIYLDPIL